MQTVKETIESITEAFSESMPSVPVAQRLLRAGFKKITKEQIRERLSCDLIEAKANRVLYDKFKLSLKDKDVPIEVILKKDTPYWGYRINDSLGSYARYDSTPIYACEVEMKPLNEYVEEVIPDRVLDSIASAHSHGATDFKVAYPVLSNDTGTAKKEYATDIDKAGKPKKQIPLPETKDPIVVAIFGESMIEIDFWE